MVGEEQLWLNIGCILALDPRSKAERVTEVISSTNFVDFPNYAA